MSRRVMARRARISDEDRELWSAYARTVRQLAGRSVSAPLPAPIPEPPAIAQPVQTAPPLRRVPTTQSTALDIGAHPAGLDRATWSRFRDGRLPIARRLDLHGRTAQDAHQALGGFLRAAQADGVRCVEIITGRGSATGTGTIRRELPHWLNLPALRPLVLAASHPDGNTGATRLLLRRVRGARP